MRKKSSLSVSVIIPTHNRHKKLKIALQSILRQTVFPQEIIIIDNSTDNNTKIYLNAIPAAQKKDLIYIREPSVMSSYYARNIGIHHAKCDVVAFLDDDCIPDKNWIYQIKYYLTENPGAAVMGKSRNADTGNLISIADDFKTRRLINNNISKAGRHYLSGYLDTKNFAVKRKILIKNKLQFDRQFFSGGDIDFGFQLQNKGIPIHYNPGMLVYHSGVNSLARLMRKEFVKGKGKYTLEGKWNISPDADVVFFFKKLVSDINGDEIIKYMPFPVRVYLFLLIISATISFILGKKIKKWKELSFI